MSSEPSPLPELAAFQAALLEVLHQGGTPEAMRTRLLSYTLTPDLIAYIGRFDDRMLIVASELVRKWGRR